MNNWCKSISMNDFCSIFSNWFWISQKDEIDLSHFKNGIFLCSHSIRTTMLDTCLSCLFARKHSTIEDVNLEEETFKWKKNHFHFILHRSSMGRNRRKLILSRSSESESGALDPNQNPIYRKNRRFNSFAIRTSCLKSKVCGTIKLHRVKLYCTGTFHFAKIR